VTDRTRRFITATIIAVALIAFTAARIHAVSELRPRAWLLTYVHLADLINQGTMPVDQIGDVSPTYLWLMVAMRAFGLSPMAVCTIQLAMLTLSAVFCAIAAKRIAGWPAAIATAVLILGNRAAYVIATELDPKALIFFLTSAAFALLPTSENRRSPTKRTLIAALLLGLSAVTHPYGYLVLMVITLFHRRWAMLAALIPVAFIPLASFIAIPPDSAGHSSSQFYEGNNPLATGAAGVAPLVVSDMQASMKELSPDPVYRRLGVDWRAKALANVRAYPRAAMRRFAWKALLTVHNFDVYDVATARQKSVRLARLPSVPFGAAFALALIAFLVRRDRRALAPFALVAIVLMIALTLFVVSARQRNVLLVPLSILGGAGAAEIIALARSRNERALLAFGGVLIATALLGIEGRPMREHEYKWTRRAEADAPELLFDRSLMLEARGAWPQAEIVLAAIASYQPLRENHAVSSVSYYRARSALRMRAPARVIHALLDRAEREAPGDPFVLALRAVATDRNALRALDALHDPYTRDFALALALIDSGHDAMAETMLASLTRRLPQWKRPAQIRAEGHASRTTNPRSGSREAGR
jgi:hypothetical protein